LQLLLFLFWRHFLEHTVYMPQRIHVRLGLWLITVRGNEVVAIAYSVLCQN